VQGQNAGADHRGVSKEEERRRQKICKIEASRKRKQEGGLRGGETSKAAFVARAKDDRHSHACILPECGMFCTPKAKRGREKDKDSDTLRIRHSCQVYKK